MKAPMNRMGTADAHLVDLGDLVDYSNPGGNKLLSRRFEEIEESAGDSLFTEFYANGRIEEQHLSVVHHLGAFDSGAKGIKTGMRREMLAKELGKETWKSERISIYSCVDPVERLNGNPKATYECAWFFFENGLLIGMTFHLMGDC